MDEAGELRALARRLRRAAEELAAEADMVLRAVERVPWTGQAADAMRWSARREVRALRACADLHAAGADALDAHAGRVAQRTGALHAVGSLLEHVA
jgi:hypothetical protein